MRPVEFSPEEIIQAGQGLQATGRNITGFALRQRVGGGNPTRLKQVWDEHINSQTVTKAEPFAELPVEVAEEVAAVTKALTERLSALAVELNDKAVKAAERRVHEVVRTAGEQREQAERELTDASLIVDDLENKLDEATSTAAGLEKRLEDSQANNYAQAVELAQVSERLALIEQAAKAATEQHTTELVRLNTAIESERQEQRKAIAQEVHRADEGITKAQAERDSARKELDQLRAELAKVQAKAEAAEQTYQDQRKVAAQEAHRAAEGLTKVQAERDSARKEASTAREEAARLCGQVESLQTQVAGQLHVLELRQAPNSEV